MHTKRLTGILFMPVAAVCIFGAAYFLAPQNIRNAVEQPTPQPARPDGGASAPGAAKPEGAKPESPGTLKETLERGIKSHSEKVLDWLAGPPARKTETGTPVEDIGCGWLPDSFCSLPDTCHGEHPRAVVSDELKPLPANCRVSIDPLKGTIELLSKDHKHKVKLTAGEPDPPIRFKPYWVRAVGKKALVRATFTPRHDNQARR